MTNPLREGRTDLGCTMVADGCLESLPEGSRGTISLQIMVDRTGLEPVTSAVQAEQLQR